MAVSKVQKPKAKITPRFEVSGNWKKFLATGAGGKTKPSAGSQVPLVQSLFPESHSLQQARKYVGLRCVVVRSGPMGALKSIARVVAINYNGSVLYDSFIRTEGDICPAPGITADHLLPSQADASKNRLGHCLSTLFEVQEALMKLTEGKVVVGWDIGRDLSALMLSVNHRDIRDPSRCWLLRPQTEQAEQKELPVSAAAAAAAPQLVTLSMMAQMHLGFSFEMKEGSPDYPIEQARIAMLLYRKVREPWELKIRNASKQQAK